MDLHTVESVVAPSRRSECWPWQPGDAVLAGGTWLFSEPQVHVRRLVDLTGLGWPAVTLGQDGIELAATCTIERVAALSAELARTHPQWPAAPLFHQCASALLASFKIWRTATIGGNLCLSFPAGAMISLMSALDATVTVWRADGSDYTLPVTEFVTGAATNVLAPGDIVRSVFFPAAALRGAAAFRRVAPSPLGRNGIVVLARRDDPTDGGAVTVSITAATVRPYVFRFAQVPAPDELAAAHATIGEDAWTIDAHGDPDWRRGVSLVLAHDVCAALR